MTVDIHHRQCRGVAFVYDHKPQIGERFPLSSHVIPPEMDGDYIICANCGKRVDDPHADLWLMADWIAACAADPSIVTPGEMGYPSVTEEP